MNIVPEDLTELTDNELYDLLDALTRYRQRHGNRTAEGAKAKEYCKAERARVKAELKSRGAPATRPDDQRVYGTGLAAWQRAGAA